MLLIFFGCLLAVETAVRIPQFWTLDPRSSTGEIGALVQAVLGRSPEPQVVFIGSSRSQYGVSPMVVAEAMGLRTDEVANLSLSAGTPLDYLKMYRNNRSVLSGAELLVIYPAARDFNWESPEGPKGELTNRFRQHASLAERIEVPDWRDKTDMIAGWFWRTWDARFLLRGYVERTGQIALGQLPEGPVFKFDELERALRSLEVDAIPPKNQPRRNPHDVEFLNFRFSQMQARSLVELVELAKDDGVEVLLVEMPLNPLTVDEIEKSFSEEDALWRKYVREATGLEVQQVPFDGAPCIDDWKVCYFDYGHMNVFGARAYSEASGQWLLRELAR